MAETDPFINSIYDKNNNPIPHHLRGILILEILLSITQVANTLLGGYNHFCQRCFSEK